MTKPWNAQHGLLAALVGGVLYVLFVMNLEKGGLVFPSDMLGFFLAYILIGSGLIWLFGCPRSPSNGLAQ